MDTSRQEKCSFIPNNFQNLINDKKLVLIGCGGVGSNLAHLLVRGGFSNITIVDMDLVDNTNLQRQTFFEKDIGNLKTSALKSQLKEINPNLNITEFKNFVCRENISEICYNSDLIIDATDNFETRKVINDFSSKSKIPWIYTGAIKAESIVCMFLEDKFDKIFPKNIENEKCCEVGVLASTTTISASLAFNEILKYFSGEKEFKLIKYNIWQQKLFTIKV